MYQDHRYGYKELTRRYTVAGVRDLGTARHPAV